jgi:putative endonuclease
MYYVYMLKSINCEDEDFYIGFTEDVWKREEEHNQGLNKSTKHCQWMLVYFEAYVSKSYAMIREKELKRNRRMKQLLVERERKSLK